VYKEHYIFEKPNNENAKIWRYLDFAEFVSALEKNALFFSVLSKFEDKFEGSITQVDLEERVSLYDYLKTVWPEYSNAHLRSKEQELRKRLRSLVCVSSWHKNECESAAMWKMHLQNNKGVALQSTFKLLTESFSDYKKNDVYVGMIKYIDYSKHKIPNDHFIQPIMHKRLSFECERELRALISKIPIDNPLLQALNWRKYREGIYVPVDLEKLVQRVYVYPTSKKWFFEAVKSIAEKYLPNNDFSERVMKSDLTNKKTAFLGHFSFEVY